MAGLDKPKNSAKERRIERNKTKVTGLGDALKGAIQQAQENSMAVQAIEPEPVINGLLIKPDCQIIERPKHLKWRWYRILDKTDMVDYPEFSDELISVESEYIEGDYFIYVHQQLGDRFSIGASQAKQLADLLLSAVHWKEIWQSNAGEYLANDGWRAELVRPENKRGK